MDIHKIANLDLDPHKSLTLGQVFWLANQLCATREVASA